MTQTVTTKQPGRYEAADRERVVAEPPKAAALPGTSAEHRTDFARDRARVLHCAALRRLADNNLTATAFESQMRDQISEQEAASGLIAGLHTPRAYAALAAIYTVESRDVGFFPIEPNSVPQPATPIMTTVVFIFG